MCNDCQDCFGSVCLSNKRFCFFNKQLTQEEYTKKLAEWNDKHLDDVMEEVNKIRKTMPKFVTSAFEENCQADYYAYNNKDSYYLQDATRNENSGYLNDSHWNKDSFDITYAASGQSSYEVTDASGFNSCFYCRELVDCVNCLFSENLVNCQDCIGCLGLHSKQYCILNRQYTKEEYEKLKKEILGSFEPKLLT
jgi:hypothetical protein